MTARVEVPVVVTKVRLKLAVVALGTPLTLRLTELEPFTSVAATVVELLEPPRFTVSEVGDTERLKSGATPPPPTVNEPMAVLHR